MRAPQAGSAEGPESRSAHTPPTPRISQKPLEEGTEGHSPGHRRPARASPFPSAPQFPHTGLRGWKT